MDDTVKNGINNRCRVYYLEGRLILATPPRRLPSGEDDKGYLAPRLNIIPRLN